MNGREGESYTHEAVQVEEKRLSSNKKVIVSKSAVKGGKSPLSNEKSKPVEAYNSSKKNILLKYFLDYSNEKVKVIQIVKDLAETMPKKDENNGKLKPNYEVQ